MVSKNIIRIRKSIDDVDDQVIKLLLERFQLVEEIAYLKRSMSIPISDDEREKVIHNKITESVGTTKYLSYIIKIFRTILSNSKDFQRENIYG